MYTLESLLRSLQVHKLTSTLDKPPPTFAAAAALLQGPQPPPQQELGSCEPPARGPLARSASSFSLQGAASSSGDTSTSRSARQGRVLPSAPNSAASQLRHMQSEYALLNKQVTDKLVDVLGGVAAIARECQRLGGTAAAARVMYTVVDLVEQYAGEGNEAFVACMLGLAGVDMGVCELGGAAAVVVRAREAHSFDGVLPGRAASGV